MIGMSCRNHRSDIGPIGPEMSVCVTLLTAGQMDRLMDGEIDDDCRVIQSVFLEFLVNKSCSNL